MQKGLGRTTICSSFLNECRSGAQQTEVPLQRGAGGHRLAEACATALLGSTFASLRKPQKTTALHKNHPQSRQGSQGGLQGRRVVHGQWPYSSTRIVAAGSCANRKPEGTDAFLAKEKGHLSLTRRTGKAVSHFNNAVIN